MLEVGRFEKLDRCDHYLLGKFVDSNGSYEFPVIHFSSIAVV
jgi:hypothetical protein